MWSETRRKAMLNLGRWALIRYGKLRTKVSIISYQNVRVVSLKSFAENATPRARKYTHDGALGPVAFPHVRPVLR